ncbi:dUTP diphosphatase [Patescibacteria group bacterium]|nr:dUTP diphosphatase [Patescibacteria group bacterium]
MLSNGKLKIKQLIEDAMIPTYNHDTDAGLDLYSCEDTLVAPGERRAVGTGISVALPRGHVGLVWDRSGLALKQGLTTFGGVIDEGYRGEIKVILYNTTSQYVEIKKHDRIAQLLLQRVEKPKIEIVNYLADSDRGEKGFGSSGK